MTEINEINYLSYLKGIGPDRTREAFRLRDHAAEEEAKQIFNLAEYSSGTKDVYLRALVNRNDISGCQKLRITNRRLSLKF